MASLITPRTCSHLKRLLQQQQNTLEQLQHTGRAGYYFARSTRLFNINTSTSAKPDKQIAPTAPTAPLAHFKALRYGAC